MHYILYSLLIFGFVLGILFVAFRLYLLINNKGYERKFQESFQYGLDDKTDKAIQGYKDIINSAGSTNPVLINTYLLLSKAYQSKGPDYYKPALDAVNNAIKLVQNKKVNQEEMYLKQALLYKAQFLIETGGDKEAAELIGSIEKEYADDPVVKRKIWKLGELMKERERLE